MIVTDIGVLYDCRRATRPTRRPWTQSSLREFPFEAAPAPLHVKLICLPELAARSGPAEWAPRFWRRADQGAARGR
jgi:hypothetical protein